MLPVLIGARRNIDSAAPFGQLMIGRPDKKVSTGRDNRMFVEGALSIVM